MIVSNTRNHKTLRFMRVLITIFFGLVLLFGCRSDIPVRNFNIELRHFFGAEGYTLYYILNQDSLKLRYNCDFENCKDTLIYKIPLNQELVSDFYTFLANLKYDKLDSRYETDGLDGRFTDVKISGDSIPTKSIHLVRYQHETIEKLIDKVDLLIPDIKYRLYRYKYEKEM